MMNKKIELLSPAGDLEKLKIAITYGADAVYMGGKSLGLRAKAKNFDMNEMAEGIAFAHKHNAKIYITANIFAHEEDFEGAAEYFKELYQMGVDALIISDPGLFSIARNAVPDMDIHISTQSNNTNFQTALFWKNLGAQRVVLARELSFDEINSIHSKMNKIDKDFELEAFVHGAMCISYSGRCLLSNYMTGRDSNRGECAHPCRWQYYFMEEKRPGEYMPVYEDERGTYIYNSKDLCMIGHIPELVESGIRSFKIEGRMKTSYYVAAVTKAYREAIDDYFEDKEKYLAKKPYYLRELEKSSHRDFTTGFYFNKPGAAEQIYTNNSYIRNYDFVALIEEFDKETGLAYGEQRNKFSVGDEVEIFNPKGENFKQKITEIYNEEGEPLKEAPHPKQKLKIKLDHKVEKFSMLRKATES